MEVTLQIPLVDQIKAHIKKHKKKYISGARFIVVGGICYCIGIRVGSARMLSPSIFGVNNKLEQRVFILLKSQDPL